MIKGVDLAYCNIAVNYQAMKAAGFRFAIIKLGQGLLPGDPQFATHVAGCESIQMPWDLYWFCDYRQTGQTNAQKMIEKASGRWGQGHVVQDLEFNDRFGPRPNGRKMLNFCLSFFATLEAMTGIVGVLYTNRDLLNQMWTVATSTDKQELSRHDLWFATDDQTPAPTHLPILINQYELDIRVPWCQGSVDFNDFMGTEEAFQLWCGGIPEPLTDQQRITRLELEVFGYSL